MKLFSYFYEICIKLAKHRKAPLFLCANSFIESIFWPIPPDVMLAPMCLARPQRAFSYALVTTISSVLGAIIGYYLGYLIYDPYIADFIRWINYEEAMATVRSWLVLEYGMLMIFVGAFTPVPYKVIAITTGVVAAESMATVGSSGYINIFTFVAVSLFGRGCRFYLVAAIIKFGGERMEKALRKYIDILGWLCVLLIILYIVYEIYWN